MAIIDVALYEAFNNKDNEGKFKPDELGNIPVQSEYNPGKEEQGVRQMVVDSFRWADVSLRKPRREFNDLSVLGRMTYDQMAFNIYQPNNAQGYAGDEVGDWKSHAMRPIVRNKVISIASHATARMLFPKVFAFNEQSESQEDAAQVMRDLIEWASDQADYQKMTLYSVINALVNPASFTHLEYVKLYKTIKKEKGENGRWKMERVYDEENSGFKLTPVPVDELYIADFYTENIQDQEYVIWRRVQTYGQMMNKYGKHPNWKYVKPGMQVIYNDANVSFYEVYDSNLRGSLCEEVIFYNKGLDLQIYMVNGVMLCDWDNPNPRLDKQYPFIAFGYENFDEGRSIYKKSLAFKVQPDADIVNTLYPLIIDGTYLSVMPPLIIAGEESISSDVVIPGMTTTLMNPASAVTPLRVGQDIRAGMEMLKQVEESINESSESNVIDQPAGGNETAYETSVKVQQARILLGPFISMISSYVRQYGKLLMSDIIQHITIGEVNQIVDNGELIYKSIIVPDRQSDGGIKSRRIKFDGGLPDEVDEDEELERSYDILERQGGDETKEEIYEVNPAMFSSLKYKIMVSPDVITPMSDEMEKALGLELFDRAIGLPFVNQEEVAKDFLFNLYPKAKEDVNKYFLKEEPLPDLPGMNPGMEGMMGEAAMQGVPQGVPQGKGQPVQFGNNTKLGQSPRSGGSPLSSAGRVSPMAAMRTNPLTNKAR